MHQQKTQPHSLEISGYTCICITYIRGAVAKWLSVCLRPKDLRFDPYMGSQPWLVLVCSKKFKTDLLEIYNIALTQPYLSNLSKFSNPATIISMWQIVYKIITNFCSQNKVINYGDHGNWQHERCISNKVKWILFCYLLREKKTLLSEKKFHSVICYFDKERQSKQKQTIIM